MLMNEHPQESIPAFVLGTLDAEEALLVSAHLVRCSACRVELEAFEALLAALPYASTPREPPHHVKQQLLARIANQAPAMRARPRWVPAVAAGMAALALVLAVMLYDMNSRISTAAGQLQGSQQTITEMSGQIAQGQQAIGQLRGHQQQVSTAVAELNSQHQQDQAAIARMREQVVQDKQIFGFIAAARPVWLGGSDRHSSAIMYMRPASKQAVLVVAGMPRAQAGKTYQLWLVHGSAPVPSATFDVDQEGVALLTIEAPLPVNQYDHVMVTVEQRGGSQAPSDQVVLSGPLATLDQTSLDRCRVMNVCHTAVAGVPAGAAFPNIS
jgi:anti-sigma-K factor RskA